MEAVDLVFGVFPVVTTLIVAAAGFGKLRQEVADVREDMAEIKTMVRELALDLRRELREIDVLVRGDLAPRVSKLEEACRIHHGK
jgi:hypothetical protein